LLLSLLVGIKTTGLSTDDFDDNKGKGYADLAVAALAIYFGSRAPLTSWIVICI